MITSTMCSNDCGAARLRRQARRCRRERPARAGGAMQSIKGDEPGQERTSAKLAPALPAARSEALSYHIQIAIDLHARAQKISARLVRVVITQIPEAYDVSRPGAPHLLSFSNRILRPVQIDPTQVAPLCG